MTIGKSQALYSTQKKKRSCTDRSCALLSIGPIQIDIPQHPVVLHGMMTRGTKQLSTTLQELRATTSRQPTRSRFESLLIAFRNSSLYANGFRYRLDESLGTSESTHSPKPSKTEFETSSYANHRPSGTHPEHPALIQPIVVQFNIILDGLTVGAALLPSLTAKYQVCVLR